MTLAARRLSTQHDFDEYKIQSLASKLVRLPPPLLERVIELAIDRLDNEIGDPDLELTGDEYDGTNAEDEVQITARRLQPFVYIGCKISDPG